MPRTRYVVRKLDLDDEFFNVVDTRVEGWQLISEESVVHRSRSHRAAIDEADRLNSDDD